VTDRVSQSYGREKSSIGREETLSFITGSKTGNKSGISVATVV
jgi:hypothetical protein